MVIEGQFISAQYERNHKQTVAKFEVLLTDAELDKLVNGLANRRMDMIQMVINSSAVAVADPNDTPTTSTESW